MYVRGREVKFRLVGESALKKPNVYWFAFSATLIVISIVALITMGLNLGIEFKGGYLVKLRLDQAANVEDVRGILSGHADVGLNNAIVQTAEDGHVLTLRMPFIDDATTRNDTINNVKNELDQKYGIAETMQEEQVGSEWGQEVSRKALIALGVFVVLIILFITFRLEFKMAIAGIMGGEESEVADTSSSILLESANFEPIGILESSERLKLRTEGSNRWEKGVDPYLAGQAAELATELIVQLAGARWVGQTDIQGELPARPVVQFRPERANELIGVEIPAKEQRGLLERFGFEVANDWAVTVPTFRARDVTREVDLVEEIARVHLDEVPFTLPARREMWGRLTREQRLRRRAEDVLSGLGFVEAYTYSLVESDPDKNAIPLPDPLTAEHALLRTTILGGLIESLERNLDAGNEDIALFEIAHVYLPAKEELPAEPVRIAGLVEGGFARAKGAVEVLYHALAAPAPVFEPAGELPFLHPFKAAKVGQAGWVGELHPELAEGEWGAFELDLSALAEVSQDVVVYSDVISFPAVKQDLSFVVAEGVLGGEMIAAAREATGADLRGMEITDVYRGAQLGEGKKSITFAVAFQSEERTLSDAEAASLREKIVQALAERFGAELRS